MRITILHWLAVPERYITCIAVYFFFLHRLQSTQSTELASQEHHLVGNPAS